MPCPKCHSHPGSWAHFTYCMKWPASYYQCVVPKCAVKTRRPTREGMCPKALWDEQHERYYARLKAVA